MICTHLQNCVLLVDCILLTHGEFLVLEDECIINYKIINLDCVIKVIFIQGKCMFSVN